MKKTLIALACCTIALSGCKTPEERAMDQFDEAMKKQAYMMKRMQETMDRTAQEMEKADK
jgi:outer membrane protein assembly factor BamE (lipoprotein component of BamABCDE complex)